MIGETASQGFVDDASASRASTTDRAVSSAHEKLDRFAVGARNIEQELRSRSAELKRQAGELRLKAAMDAKTRKAKAYFLKKPLLSVGIALTAGAVLAGLFVRR